MLGEKTGISRDTPARICGLAVVADAWLKDWLAEISADIQEAH